MRRRLAFLAAPLALLAAAPPAPPDSVAAFNGRFETATRRMDNAVLDALWEEDGISLLPQTAPIVGRQAIAGFVAKAMAQFPGAHMTSFTLACANPVESAQLASEWCFEHQMIDLGGGKSFDGKGRMLLVLQRGPDKRWRLLREMWVAAETDAS